MLVWCSSVNAVIAWVVARRGSGVANSSISDRLGPDRQAEGEQPGQGVAEAGHPAPLGVVGVQGAVGPALEDRHGEPGQHPLGAALDEHPGAVLVHPLHLAGPLDRAAAGVADAPAPPGVALGVDGQLLGRALVERATSGQDRATTTERHTSGLGKANQAHLVVAK